MSGESALLPQYFGRDVAYLAQADLNPSLGEWEVHIYETKVRDTREKKHTANIDLDDVLTLQERSALTDFPAEEHSYGESGDGLYRAIVNTAAFERLLRDTVWEDKEVVPQLYAEAVNKRVPERAADGGALETIDLLLEEYNPEQHDAISPQPEEETFKDLLNGWAIFPGELPQLWQDGDDVFLRIPASQTR